jgi:hypothetical protein
VWRNLEHDAGHQHYEVPQCTPYNKQIGIETKKYNPAAIPRT